MATAESTTGCFTCIDSPGYTDVQHPNVLNTELRTPPAPLTEVLLGYLGQLKDAVPPSQCVQATANPCVLLVESQLPPYIKSQDDVTTCEDGDPEGVVSVGCAYCLARPPTFRVLTNTPDARWISRLALDPLKLKTIAREFVYSQFEDGDRSRWIIALLANIGSRVGSAEFVEGKQTPMLSALQTVTRQRLKAVKSKPNPKRTELVKAFDSATEAMVVQFYASPISEAVTLRQEAASIFRQLCPEPLDTPISLPSLLQNPLDCLWRYAEIDIIFSVTADMPTLFRYDVGILGSQPFSPYRSVSTIQREGIVQWLRGIPNQLVLLFAHMKTMREDGLIPNRETIMSLERGIHELQPFHGSASERFIAIMRSVVQECWRQAAFIYLYMAVCGDSPDTPRVREAFKRYMRLLNTTEPGRLPDEFLIFSFVLMGPAAQRRRDREVIRQRALRLHTRDCTHIATSWIILVIDDIWARADAEQRLAMWSDVAVSRKQFLNV
ncbi:hypothetical protein B0J17DRAFT_702895 [Rhizoctonia solani]|nr:hypothetical protein B0J17DRAFT_702895 [Rhizoctonia solani]